METFKPCARCTAKSYTWGCALGYSTDGHGRPTEPCPRPLTYLALEEERKEAAGMVINTDFLP